MSENLFDFGLSWQKCGEFSAGNVIATVHRCLTVFGFGVDIDVYDEQGFSKREAEWTAEERRHVHEVSRKAEQWIQDALELYDRKVKRMTEIERRPIVATCRQWLSLLARKAFRS